MTTDKYGTAWSNEELVLALFLYCQIPFSKTKANNPSVITLAHAIGRTPASVARKLGNFGAFDEALAEKGITGLKHASKADEILWKKYSGSWDKLVVDAKALLTEYRLTPSDELRIPLSTLSIEKGQTRKTETSRLTTIRLGQAFFRRAVLASYEESCCICLNNLPQLLVASHIVPWSNNSKERLNPRNGLCLCALHDKAFDVGLMGIDGAYAIRFKENLRKSTAPIVRTTLLDFENQQLALPKRFLPDQEFLKWHFVNVFRG